MLGVDFWVEFPGDVAFDGPTITAPQGPDGLRDPSTARSTLPFYAQSTQVFVGPRIGFAFGR
jgi:hypothetical protein